MTKQYWADAATQNCVWLFQIKREIVISWRELREDEEPTEESEINNGEVPDETEEYWETEAVFLTRIDAYCHGKRRTYAWGEYNVGWRLYGVPCYGEMVERISQSGFNQEVVDERLKEYYNTNNEIT